MWPFTRSRSTTEPDHVGDAAGHHLADGAAARLNLIGMSAGRAV